MLLIVIIVNYPVFDNQICCHAFPIHDKLYLLLRTLTYPTFDPGPHPCSGLALLAYLDFILVFDWLHLKLLFLGIFFWGTTFLSNALIVVSAKCFHHG